MVISQSRPHYNSEPLRLIVNPNVNKEMCANFSFESGFSAETVFDIVHLSLLIDSLLKSHSYSLRQIKIMKKNQNDEYILIIISLCRGTES